MRPVSAQVARTRQCVSRYETRALQYLRRQQTKTVFTRFYYKLEGCRAVGRSSEPSQPVLSATDAARQLLRLLRALPTSELAVGGQSPFSLGLEEPYVQCEGSEEHS